MEDLDKQVDSLFKRVMERCRSERKAKTKSTLRNLAKDLERTENYLSSIENGREFPSMKIFLRYLLINGFDVSPLTNLSIEERGEGVQESSRRDLLEKIYRLDEEHVDFLREQSKVFELFRQNSMRADKAREKK